MKTLMILLLFTVCQDITGTIFHPDDEEEIEILLV
jgi:hypothetical protein